MMGSTEQAFGPLPPVSLEDLVPPDHVSRHLERTLDLGFVRDLVRGTYADSGRPSIKPVVFFKLQVLRRDTCGRLATPVRPRNPSVRR